MVTRCKEGYSLWLIVYSFYMIVYNLFLSTSLKSTLNVDNLPIALFFSVLLMLLILKDYKYYLNINHKKKVVIIILGLLLILTTYKSHNVDLCLAFLFILSARNEDFDKFVKIDFFIRLISLIAIFFFCYAGMLHDIQLLRQGIVRHSFGYYHPNTLGITLFVLLLEIFYLFKSNNKILVFIWGLVIIIFNHVFIKSRSSEIASIVVYIFSVLEYSKNIIHFIYQKWIQKIIIAIPVLLFILTIVTVYFFHTSPFYFKLNQLLSGRVWYMHTLLENNGFKLLGQVIPEMVKESVVKNGLKPMYADNTYFSIILKNGYIFTIVFLTYLSITTKKILLDKNTAILICFLGFLIVGLMETRLAYFQFNFILFYLVMKRNNMEMN